MTRNPFLQALSADDHGRAESDHSLARTSGYRIKPFDGDPHDEELLRAVEAVEASGV